MPDVVMNKKHYEKKHVISNYTHTALQNSEVMIFVKYKEYIWDKQILDIGCGAGRTTAYLKNLSRNYTGLDYSLDMIKSCKKKFKNVHLIHGDVRNMDLFEDKMFDFVLFSFNGLDSICHEDRLRGLQEIHRVLKQNGIFAFSSHNRNHRNANSPPRMAFTSAPCAQIGNLIKFVKSTYNHSKNKKLERFDKEYSIINDKAHNYALLTYYIDKGSQISQLRKNGFDVIEMYDTFGNKLDIDDDDKDSAWIYYVVRRMN